MTRPDDRWIRHTVSADDSGKSLQEILVGPLGISRRMIQRLTRSAGIRLNGRAAFLGRKLRGGDVVAVRVASRESGGLPAVDMPLVIVYEDRDLLVVDKPAGLLVHPVGHSGEATLAHGVTSHFQRQGLQAKVRPVHRLDRDTSGLVLLAKTAFAHQALDRQLREREMRRSYRAIVSGIPSPAEQIVDLPIGPHPRHDHLRAVARKGGDPAITQFRVGEVLREAALLEIELETGRTHQIRVHLSHIGHPVLGDAQYGGPVLAGLTRQALHATKLSFRHPVSKQVISLACALPDELAAVLAALSTATASDGQGRGESASS